MKTIAIDIDDVLALSAEGFVAYSNKVWGTNLAPDDYDEHWAKVWQISNQETERRADHFNNSGEMQHFKPITYGERVLRQLQKSYKLVIVTSRRLVTKEITTQWLDRHYPGMFSDIHYAGIWDVITNQSIHATKRDVCEQIGAEYLIDDQLRHCLAASDAGILAVLFGDYSWNQADSLPSDVARCADWQEVELYFEKELVKNSR